MQGILSEKTFDILSINKKALADCKSLVKSGESAIEKEVELTAKRIFEEGEKLKIVLLSGRSASGKTTFTKKVCKKLCEMGREAGHISLDDFFLGIDYLPVNEDGTYDMESIKGVDVELANSCFGLLLKEGAADFPTFDFPNQRRGEKWNRVEIGKNGIIMIEGIHALNPLLTENLPEEGIMRVYIEPQCGYCEGEKQIFSSADVRLMRRMTRDELFRGWSAEKTLLQWKSVLEGEKIYIEPYIGLAKIKVDSSIEFEPAVFRSVLTKMLENTEEKSQFFGEAQRFIKNLAKFEEISKDFLDKDSLLREFVG